MDLAILTTYMQSYSSKRIAEEALSQGHFVECIDHTRTSVVIGGKAPELFFEGENVLEQFSAIIPRIGNNVTRHGVAIVKQFEKSGCYSTAHSKGILRARNKVMALQIFAAAGLPIPKTIFAMSAQELATQMAILGGPPFIIKLQEGTQGVGVVLAESLASAQSIMDSFYKLEAPILVQEYIEESKGEDIRIFVVDNEVVAAMKRSSELGEFRSNFHRGGQVEVVTPTNEEVKIALDASKKIGLAVAGVDIIRSKRGPLLLEVNASPGLEGIETATNINVALKIIKMVERNARK